MLGMYVDIKLSEQIVFSFDNYTIGVILGFGYYMCLAAIIGGISYCIIKEW